MTDSSSASRDVAAARYVDIQHNSDGSQIADRLGAWLASRLPEGADPAVSDFDANATNGMSSDTVLFDATWQEAGDVRKQGFVARIAPDESELLVFPRYDLAQQFDTIAKVAELSDVPVPELWWSESDPGVLGRSFFIMTRVAGKVPPDVLPYTFGDNWLFDATSDDRARLQAHTIDVLAGIQSIDNAAERFTNLELSSAGSTHLERHLADVTDWYRWSLETNPASDLIESALTKLAATVPADPGQTVLSWGDARIGNVIFDDFVPVGVLDWEMAVLGPRELDLAWLVYSHRVFQDLAVSLGAEGIPDFMRTDDVLGAYESATGHTVTHFDWHLLFAATRWAIVFLRTGARLASVAGDPLPADGNDLLHNKPSLEQLLDGSYEY